MRISRGQVLTHVGLSIPIIISEFVTSTNLTGYYTNHEPHFVAAVLLSVAFSVMLAGSTVIVARPKMPFGVRFLLMGGIVSLFFIQAVSNVSGSYLTAVSHKGTFDILDRFWGPGWMEASSLLFGGGINLIAMCYWLSLAFYLRKDLEDQERMQEQLQRLVGLADFSTMMAPEAQPDLDRSAHYPHHAAAS